MQSPRTMLLRHFLGVSLALALAACGGGSSPSANSTSTGQSPDATSASSAVSSATASASSRSSSGTASSSTSSNTASSSSTSPGGAVYATTPSVSHCLTGQISSADKTAVLARVNEIRTRHGLPAVSYDNADDAAAAAAALYMVANGGLTHTPSAGGACYTSEAARLAGVSNLYMAGSSANTRTMASADAITTYLVDSNVSSLGHRRWILYPFLATTSFGRVDSDDGKSMASVLRTIGGNATSVSMNNDFVAYPYGSYPASDFSTSWYLSFSVVASKTSAYANGSSQVSFSSASITVTDSLGAALAVNDRLEDYTGYGLANSLQWKVSGLASGGSYTVKISGVRVNGASRDFSYGFQLQ